MRKKKRQVTLNIRLLGIQLLTLLPVFLLLIFVSYSMLRNLSGQIYDIRENGGAVPGQDDGISAGHGAYAL